MKKMFSIKNQIFTQIWENANQNYETSFCSRKIASYQADKRYHMTTIGNNMEIHLKLNIELPYDPAIQFLGIFPREMKSVCQRDIYTPMCIESLFTNNQEMETTPGSLTTNG